MNEFKEYSSKNKLKNNTKKDKFIQDEIITVFEKKQKNKNKIKNILKFVEKNN